MSTAAPTCFRSSRFHLLAERIFQTRHGKLQFPLLLVFVFQLSGLAKIPFGTVNIYSFAAQRGERRHLTFSTGVGDLVEERGQTRSRILHGISLAWPIDREKTQ